jgi:lipoprotein-anchoring transpeptidase ErfK/SrfK
MALWHKSATLSLMSMTIRPTNFGRSHHVLTPSRTSAASVVVAVAVFAITAGAMPHALADPESDVAPAEPIPSPEVVEQMASSSPDDQVPPSDDPAAAPPAIPFMIPFGAPAGQDPTPFVGSAPFALSTISPSDGATVGIAKPVVINFSAPVSDRAMAEQAIHISSDPPLPGQFYWMNDSQVRWRPMDFWPAHTTIGIDAGGTRSSFSTGDALIAVADNDTHQLTVTRNGVVEQTFPMSMGKPGHDTANGTYYVQDKSLDVVMDSATYGVPNTSPDGYRVHVQLAVRFDNSGNYVHSAPWSVADQGIRNVSHGCINISPSNAQWFYDNFGVGDPIVVTNSTGPYTPGDGTQDWQM